MSFRLISWFALLSLILGVSNSCAKVQPQSVVKGSDSFESCDLAASGKASDEASKAAFKCAYYSLSLAGSISTGGLAKDIFDITVGLSDIYSAVVDGKELIGDLRAYLDSGGKDPDAPGVSESNKNDKDTQSVDLEDMNRLKNLMQVKFKVYEANLPRNARSAMYKCVSGQFSVFKDFLTLVALTSDLKGLEQFSSGQIKAMALAPLAFTSMLTDMMAGNLHCSMWLQGSRSLAMQKAIKGIKRIQEPIAAIMTVADCGVSIGKGGYILARNSMCLADDVKNYYASREQLESMRDNTIQNYPVPTEEQETGNRACMAKYGMYLHKQSFYSYVYRSSVCADYCGNKGPGVNYFSDRAREIYPRDDDYQWCAAHASQSQEPDAVNSCIVYCCDQDKTCAEDARQRVRY